MTDGQRQYPVNKLVIHHSVGDEMNNWEDLDVMDWFDRMGASRGYAGLSSSYHLHPLRNKDTFAQYHYAIRRYTKDNNVYGWRITPLMQKPFDNVAWHAGNWNVNREAIGVCFCGNYVSKEAEDKALLLIADTFREHDKAIGGQLHIYPHSQFQATACPGRIKEKIGLLIDMFNSPTKFEHLKEDPKMIDELKKQLAEKDNIINTKQSEVVSLQQLKASLEEKTTYLTKENQTIKQTLDQANIKHDESIKEIRTAYDEIMKDINAKVDSLTYKLAELYKEVEIRDAKILEQEKIITDLNKRIEEMLKEPAGTVLIPHESKFQKLEKIITGEYSTKDKIKMIGKDFLFAIQNSLGGLSFALGTLELTQYINPAIDIISSDYDIWIKIVVITTLFLIGFSGTKSISKNFLTSSNFTVAKIVAKDNKSKLEELEKALEEYKLLQK